MTCFAIMRIVLPLCTLIKIQPGDGRPSTGHEINPQLKCTIIRKILASLKMFKTFIPPQTDGMIRSSFNIGCSESKVIFK